MHYRSEIDYERWRAAAGLCLLAVCLCGSGRAQDVPDAKAEVKVAFPEEAKVRAAAAVRAQLEAQRQLRAAAEARAVRNNVVDSFLLRNQSEYLLKERLTRRGQQKIDHLRTVCGLRPEQVAQLQLASVGDVSRIFNAIAVMRHEMADLRTNDMNDHQEALRLLQPLLLRIQMSPSGEGSLLETALEHILDERQKAAYQQDQADRIQQRKHAFTLFAIMSIEEQVAFKKDQRESLVALIDDQPERKVAAAHETYGGFLRLARASDEELLRILDVEQLAAVRKICDRVRDAIPEVQ